MQRRVAHRTEHHQISRTYVPRAKFREQHLLASSLRGWILNHHQEVVCTT